MGKFKVKFELQGLKFEIEGSKEDVPMIGHTLGQQLAGLMAPTTDITGTDGRKDAPAEEPEESSSKKTRRKKRSTEGNGVKDVGDKASPVWRHDPSKWGAPVQGWSLADKAIWLLYVVSMETSFKELSAGQIADTFNAQFRQTGTIRPSNVSRDLGKLKQGAKAQVSEVVGSSPSRWFLTEEGIKRAASIIAQSQQEAAAS